MLNSSESFALEALIDKYGLQSIVSAIAGICYEKSEHIEESYQDTALAKKWEAISTRIYKMAGELKHAE